MGYILKSIANIQEPNRLSVAGDPNFVVFRSRVEEKTPSGVSLQVSQLPTAPLTLTEANGVHVFAPTTDPERVGGSTFYADSDLTRTAQNIRAALLTDSWVASNLEVSVPLRWQGDGPGAGDTVSLVAKGKGVAYAFSVSFLGSTVKVEPESLDSIRGEADSIVLELDIYADTGAPVGSDDPMLHLGRYATTLQKSYDGEPVWFDLNAVFAGVAELDPPADAGWFDPGTLRSYRFLARRTSYTSEAFYESGALHVLLGAKGGKDMAPYILEGSGGRLLTNKPRTPYVVGGRAYLNFVRGAVTGTVRVVYSALSIGGKELGKEYSTAVPVERLADLNTYVLELDRMIGRYPTAGLVRVALELEGRVVSDYLEFDISPGCLHEARFLSFINDFGGWDAVNLDAPEKREIKPGYSNYDRTITPDSSARERTYSVEMAETISVETAPMTDAAASWLTELARSKLVVDGQGRVVLISEFSLAIDPAARNMQRATIKYRYADDRTIY